MPLSTFIDRSGQTFGKLTVVSVAQRGKVVRWLCMCDCGKETIVRSKCLVTGNVRSCGCLAKNNLKGGAEATRTHGRSRDRLYAVWAQIIGRCTCVTDKNYPYYGGRGIVMCSAWRRSFAQFAADVGERPSMSHTLDRINNDGPYAPDNVRWATRREQANNRRSNIYLIYKGKRQTVMQWARELRIDSYTIYNQLRLGKTLPDIVEAEGLATIPGE